MANTTKPTIEVEDYYDKIHRSTWGRRTAGLIGGAVVGVTFGGIIGAVAAFLPYLFGLMGVAGAAAVAAPGIAAVASTAAVFAGVVGLMGSAAMATVGADAAAVSAGMAEKDRRDNNAEQVIVKDPAPEKTPKLFNWKVAAVTVPMMAAFGALIALSPLSASTMATLGFQGATAAAPATTAAIAASSAVFGMFGTLFGLKMSYITNKASNAAHDFITGKTFGGAPAVAPAIQVAAQPEQQPEVQIVNAPEAPGKSFASEKTRFSLQGIIEKTEERSTDKDVLITR